MSKEYKIWNGLVINNSPIITGITDDSGLTNLSTVLPTSNAVKGYVDNKISVESSVLNSNINSVAVTISGIVSTEISQRTSVDQSLSSIISTEISQRTSADSSLNNSISLETSQRTSVDQSLSSIISTEISQRTSVDISLSTEVSVLDYYFDTLNSTLSTEISTRTSADSSISIVLNNKLNISGGTLTGNLTGTTLGLTSQLYLSGITNDATPNDVLYYNSITKQVTFGTKPSGGSTAPGGNNTNVQYNNNGIFDGASYVEIINNALHLPYNDGEWNGSIYYNDGLNNGINIYYDNNILRFDYVTGITNQSYSYRIMELNQYGDITLQGKIFANLSGSTQSNILYYNTSTKEITYGVPTGGGTPGGLDGDIQFNSSGNFSGTSEIQIFECFGNSYNYYLKTDALLIGSLGNGVVFDLSSYVGLRPEGNSDHRIKLDVNGEKSEFLDGLKVGNDLIVDNKLYVTGLTSSTQSNILYYNTSTKEITYGVPSGGGTPGGSDTYVQFNDGGSIFGGTSGLTFNKTTNSLTSMGIITGSNLKTNLISLSVKVGIDAGKNEDESTNKRNIYIGYQSGYIGTTGPNDCVGIGYQTLYNNTGDYNIGIGTNSLYSNTSGNSNVAIGYNAGFSVTSGNYNVYIGRISGEGASTGSHNACVGYGTGQYLGASTGNVLFGSYAGAYLNNTTGAANYNCFIGYQCASSSNINGDYNIGIGYSSFSQLTTGSYNIGIGNSCLTSLITGTNNTSIGLYSGMGGDVSNSVYLGAYAGRYEGSSNKLFIDSLNRTDQSTARTNSLVYGEFNNSPSSQIFRINAKLELPYLTNNIKTNKVYYDSSTKELSYYSDNFAALTDAASVSWDCITGLNKTLTTSRSDITLNITNVSNGMNGKLIVYSSSYTVFTLPTNSYFGIISGYYISNIGIGPYSFWYNPIITGYSGLILKWIYDGSNYIWDIGILNDGTVA